ncbi:GNAT family N-acetyltransferase [Arthrobacter koreensis]|uniref:GNAT family N-acetyltransferase n=1 Tax=Arthrobacter koreensis TaxID=199136 RepID=UPI002DBDF8F2|nr:GNAT family N-acetyltransferase [Arthrobacter koreensis]MEB7503320.1 GNAT family N-acetyltransferase [Arthrobacter koreensis]
MDTAEQMQPAPLSLESAMDAAWPALDRRETGGWVLRAAAGVTQRANSIWPGGMNGCSDDTLAALLREARTWYRSRRLPVIFQMTDGAAAAALHALLDAEGFTRQSLTLVMTCNVTEVPDTFTLPGTPAVELSSAPSDDWMQVWWQVDGRGGDKERGIALESSPAAPPCTRWRGRNEDGRPAAVGRLALPDGERGGIYCMATIPEARRRGFGSAVLRSMLQAGNDSGVTDFWILVTAANHRAQELYARAGFRENGRYVYRQEKPRRSLPGC